MGLICEAGMPAIADPGSSIVRAAHDLGLEVVALQGPVSLMLALASSGLNGQNFAFVGYVPVQEPERSQRLQELEKRALQTQQTQIFIETPYRNEALLQALLRTLKPSTRLSVSAGLGLPTQADDTTTHSATVQTWRTTPKHRLNLSLPAVFSIGG
jgi:16S rRNA (cytidine1402-2'-O)-methyltransferase